ncbi:DUF349 domain-containing protein [Marmoricola sp. URHB0036]|uniref:DUF349 domain-containing protein n=1 Tax=Marmoricola sp. URHB0036 TaxID=1298863 RepID=UPI00041E252D
MTAQGNSPDGNGQGQTASDSGQVGGLTSEWGRVDPDGTVYVRTADGERAVGQYPEGTPEEALAFFTRRFDALAFEVQLLEQRVRAEALTPDEATESIKKVAAQLVEPNAVGDVVGLSARLDALGPLIGLQRGQRRADRARKLEEAHTRKQEIVAEAEKISQGKDWRNGVNRLRDLLEEWKALPRLERKRDDELWHRFSSARTSYTRRRKTHFAELGEKREGARVVKQRLLKEAEELSTSTDWGPTSSRFRALMSDWKAAGAAPREVEEDLWQRFRAAQDTFFGARDAANAEQDREFEANAEKKKELLVEAEKLLPVSDLEAAKRAFRDIADRWDAAGKVPRDQMKTLEGRIRKVEQAIRSVEDDKWRRSDPEKSARADDMLGQLERAISDIETNLDKARASGDDRKIRELEENLASRQQFLEMARKAASDFS